MNDQTQTTYPVLPLRDIVVFPHMIVPLFVGRDKSVRALEAVMEQDRPILFHHRLQRTDRFVTAHEQRHDHVGKHHDVAQRQHRIGGLGLIVHQSSFHARTGTAPKMAGAGRSCLDAI